MGVKTLSFFATPPISTRGSDIGGNLHAQLIQRTEAAFGENEISELYAMVEPVEVAREIAQMRF